MLCPRCSLAPLSQDRYVVKSGRTLYFDLRSKLQLTQDIQIIFGFILATPILVQLSEEIGGDTIDFWIPSGWGAAAAVGFSIAGRLSDIFGRRIVILSGQALTIVGGIIACTAQSMNQLIAGEVILGASIGTVSVAYAGIVSAQTPNTPSAEAERCSPKSCPTNIVASVSPGLSSTWRPGPFLGRCLLIS